MVAAVADVWMMHQWVKTKLRCCHYIWLQPPSHFSNNNNTRTHARTHAGTHFCMHTKCSLFLTPSIKGWGGMRTKALSGWEPFNYKPMFKGFSMELSTIGPAKLTHTLQAWHITHFLAQNQLVTENLRTGLNGNKIWSTKIYISLFILKDILWLIEFYILYLSIDDCHLL